MINTILQYLRLLNEICRPTKSLPTAFYPGPTAFYDIMKTRLKPFIAKLKPLY